MSFCFNCGSQLEDDANFCPICGASQKPPGQDNQIKSSGTKTGNKKIWILTGVVSVAIIIVLAVVVGVGVVWTNVKMKQPKSIAEAFSEYYDEFCEKHYVKDLEQYIPASEQEDSYGFSETARFWDCIGRVVYIDEKPMMMIWDLIGFTDDYDLVYNVYLFSYNGKSVEKEYYIKRVYSEDDGFLAYIKNDTLVLMGECRYYDGDVAYKLKDGEVQQYVDGDDGFEEVNGEKTKPDALLNKVNDMMYEKPQYYIFSDCFDDRLTYGVLSQDNFHDYLDELSEMKSIESNSDLETLYSDYMGY